MLYMVFRGTSGSGNYVRAAWNRAKIRMRFASRWLATPNLNSVITHQSSGDLDCCWCNSTCSHLQLDVLIVSSGLSECAGCAKWGAPF